MLKNKRILVMSIILGTLFSAFSASAIQNEAGNKISKEQIEEIIKEITKKNPEEIEKSEKNQSESSIDQKEFKDEITKIIKNLQKSQKNLFY